MGKTVLLSILSYTYFNRHILCTLTVVLLSNERYRHALFEERNFKIPHSTPYKSIILPLEKLFAAQGYVDTFLKILALEEREVDPIKGCLANTFVPVHAKNWNRLFECAESTFSSEQNFPLLENVSYHILVCTSFGVKYPRGRIPNCTVQISCFSLRTSWRYYTSASYHTLYLLSRQNCYLPTWVRHHLAVPLATFFFCDNHRKYIPLLGTTAVNNFSTCRTFQPTGTTTYVKSVFLKGVRHWSVDRTFQACENGFDYVANIPKFLSTSFSAQSTNRWS